MIYSGVVNTIIMCYI